jgi:hydrogenase maturation protease
MTTVRAPRLLLAWGNDARGDDGLGLLLAQAVRDERPPQASTADALEVLCAHQLQVEHVLDLDRREAVLLVDASVAVEATTLVRVAPGAGGDLFSHALTPAALLLAFRRVLGTEPPPTWLLALPARETRLGWPPGPDAARTLAEGLARVRHWRSMSVPRDAADAPVVSAD